MRKTAAIILAAGFSRRMGPQKLLLPMGGVPMLQRTLDVIADFPFVRRVLVTLPNVAEGIETDAQVVYNPAPESGQSSSLRLGVFAAQPGESLFCFTGDQPFLTREILSDILAADDGQSIVYPQGPDGSPRGPTLFAPCFREELLALTGDMGGRQLRNRHPRALRPISVPNPGALMDVDTPEEYKMALRILKNTGE